MFFWLRAWWAHFRDSWREEGEVDAHTEDFVRRLEDMAKPPDKIDIIVGVVGWAALIFIFLWI